MFEVCRPRLSHATASPHSRQFPVQGSVIRNLRRLDELLNMMQVCSQCFTKLTNGALKRLIRGRRLPLQPLATSPWKISSKRARSFSVEALSSLGHFTSEHVHYFIFFKEFWTLPYPPNPLSFANDQAELAAIL